MITLNTLKTELTATPRNNLFQDILARIDYEKVRQARRKFIAIISGTTVSFAVFAYALEYAIVQFNQSAFPQYMSLIVSNGADIVNYWHEFLYALTESLPLLSITFVCITFGVLLMFVKNIIKNFGMSQSLAPAYN